MDSIGSAPRKQPLLYLWLSICAQQCHMSVLSLVARKMPRQSNSLFVHHRFYHDAAWLSTTVLFHSKGSSCEVFNRASTKATSVTLTLDQALSELFSLFTISSDNNSILSLFRRASFVLKAQPPAPSLLARAIRRGNPFEFITSREENFLMRAAAALPKLGKLRWQGWLKRQSSRKCVS